MLGRCLGVASGHLWRTELRSQCSRTVVTLNSIPIHIATTMGTVPPEILFRNPRVEAYLLLSLQVLQYLTVVGKSIFAEIHH